MQQICIVNIGAVVGAANNIQYNVACLCKYHHKNLHGGPRDLSNLMFIHICGTQLSLALHIRVLINSECRSLKLNELVSTKCVRLIS